jgi:hypothetical protein
VPEHVWHYLSDADIRLKDEGYAKVQREGIVEIIAELKSGRSPNTPCPLPYRAV